jgi:hypothetical protein
MCKVTNAVMLLALVAGACAKTEDPEESMRADPAAMAPAPALKDTGTMLNTTVATASVSTEPPGWVEWNSTTVYVKTRTPSSPQYSCDYAVSITLSDGSTENRSGVTDPPTGGNPITAVTITGFSRTVSSAARTRWSCREKS